MDKKAWCAAVHEVTKSRTWLRDWTELTYWLEDQDSGISSLGKGSSNNCNKDNHCLSLHKSSALHSYSVKVEWGKVTKPNFKEKRKPKKIRRAYFPTIQPLQPRRGLGRVLLLWMDSELRSGFCSWLTCLFIPLFHKRVLLYDSLCAACGRSTEWSNHCPVTFLGSSHPNRWEGIPRYPDVGLISHI